MRQIKPVSVHVVPKSEGVQNPEHLSWVCVRGWWSGLSPYCVPPSACPRLLTGPLEGGQSLGENVLNLSKADFVFLSNVLIQGMEIGKVPPPLPGVSKPLPPSYGTYPSPAPVGPGSTNSLERRKEGSLPRPSAGLAGRQKPAPLPPAGGPHQPGSSQQIQQRISVPPSPTYPPAGLPAFPAGDGKPELPLTVAIRPFLADKGPRPQSPRKGPQTVNSSSIYSMYLQQAAPPKSHQPAAHSAANKSVKAGMWACTSPGAGKSYFRKCQSVP